MFIEAAQDIYLKVRTSQDFSKNLCAFERYIKAIKNLRFKSRIES